MKAVSKKIDGFFISNTTFVYYRTFTHNHCQPGFEMEKTALNLLLAQIENK